MPSLRPTRRHRLPRLANRHLLMLVTILSLILTPVGNTLATPAQDGNQAHLAQDGTDVPEEKSPKDPPQDGKPTEAPIETKEPPATEPVSTEPPTTEEAKPTEPIETEPVQTEPPATEPPATDPAPTELPATEPSATEPAATEPPVPNLRFTGTLIVIKGLCSDPAFDPYSATSADLATNCTQSTGDATFTYHEAATGYPERELTVTQTTIGSTTTFMLPSSNYDLQEAIPAGFGQPVVSCFTAGFAENIFMPVYVDTIRHHNPPGSTTTCHWYNVPISPSTTITIIKGTCDYPTNPAAYDPYAAASLDELLTNCTPHSTDATFTYTYSDTGDTLTQTTTGGTTSFDVQPGSFSMQEHLPPNHDSPVVGCQSTIIMDYPVFTPGNGSTIRTHIDSGDILTCYWFNIPIPPTTIKVIKGLCDAAGFDPYIASPDELAANCTQSSRDATFTYQQTHTGDPASELTLTQTTTGSATTLVIPPGNFEIREDIPTGFGEPVVSCYIDRFDIDLLLPVNIDTIASHIDLGATFTCHWYNVTLAPAGSLTVIKYTCGPSTWWSLSLCPIHRKGQDFDLLQWIDGAWVSFGIGTTDRSGRYTWTNLPPGKYALDEIGRDWCRITSDNMIPGEIAITVEPGQETIVHVYNCAPTKPISPPVRIINLIALLLRDIWNPAP